MIKIKNVLVGTNPNVDVITNIYQAREVYENTLFFSGRKIRKIVAVIWDNFSSIEIDTINTADQARKSYRNSRPGSKIRETIAIKWDELSFIEINAAKTVDQARRANRDSRPGSKSEKVSIIKWDELSLKQVLDINTIDEIRRAITFSRPGSKAEKIGKDKEEKILLELISKASNVAKVQEIRRNYLSSSNEKIKKAIDVKIEELSKI
ncbi:MAG: hypothetical protein PHS06_03970 [Candidatus Shapirobacteria bacterium]|nr:hypothetical protein [Candidatus Shapirobacteria bacterium]